MEHKIILKCRVCLDEFDEQKMFDLFTEVNDSSVGQAEFNDKAIRRLGEKVEFCCGVRIRQSVEMPTKICVQCFDMTRMWFNFRQMCLNSQVYLESLCTDRVRPPGIGDDSDGDYLEYLLDELQTFRSDKNRFNHDELNKADESESAHSESGELYEAEMEENIDVDTPSEYIEAVPYEAISCDPEFEHVIENIKKEQEDEILEETTISREHRKIKAQKKLRKCDTTPKIKHRPPSVTSYMCSICGNVYNKKASFTYHMSLHSDVKPHECELCGKGFRQVCELKNHMRRHTGEKPYKCTYCERHFTDRSEKHRHERVHTNTRPYECKICGKTFMYSAILKNHSKLHSGEKDYNCLVCQKAFTLQHQLKAHLQTISHKQKEAQFVNAGYEVVYE